MNKILVFYAGLLYGEYQFYSKYVPFHDIKDLPDGSYIRLPQPMSMWTGEPQWFRSDYTPVLPDDVPKELLLLTLLLT